MFFILEIIAVYLILLWIAPNLAKNIAVCLGLIILGFILFYLSAKYNTQIQSWKAFSMFGFTFLPVFILIWRAYVEKK